MTRLTLLLILLTLTMLIPAASPRVQAQDFVRRLTDLHLEKLTNGTAATFHSQGSSDKARRLQAAVEDMNAFFAERLSVRADVTLAVLNADDWQRVRERPMGLPGVTGEPPVIFMPATAGGPTGKLMAARRAAIPTAELQAYLTDHGTTFDSLADRFTESIGFHELGHVLSQKFGIETRSHWLSEFAASYWSYAYLSERQPDLKSVFDLLARPSSTRPQLTTLLDFDRLYAGVDDYGWYQGMFETRVRALYPKAGLKFLSDLRTIAGNIGSDDPAQVLAALETIAPGFRTWAEGFSSQAAPPPTPMTVKTHAIDSILEAGAPDGKWAIYRREEAPQKVLLRDLATGADRELITFNTAIRDWSWSLDGAQIAFSVAAPDLQGPEIHIVTVSTGNAHKLAVRGSVIGSTLAGEVFVRKIPPPAEPGATPTTTFSLASTANPGGRPVFESPNAAAASQVRTITPDGKTLLLLKSGQFLLHDLATGAERDLVQMQRVGSAVVSSDSKFLAFSASGALYVAPLDAGPVNRPIRLADQLGALAVSKTGGPSMWWTTSGDLVVPNVINATENLYRVDMDPQTGHARGPLSLLVRNADWPVISPDSREIAHTNFAGEGALGVLPANGGSDRYLTAAAQVFGWRSPSVLVMVHDEKIKTVDIRTLAEETFPEGPKGGAVDAYNALTDEVLFRGPASGTTRVLTAFSLTARKQRSIIAGDRLGSGFVVSRDGRQIAYSRTAADGTAARELRVVSSDGKDDRLLLTSAETGRRASPGAWSPDGRLLLYYSWQEDKQIRVLDVATMKSWAVVEGPGQPLWGDEQANWAPDGSFVVLGGETAWKDPVGKVFEGVGRATGQSSNGGAEPPTVLPTAATTSRTKVVLLGTGTPVADPDRFGPAVAIVVDDQSYLFDAGVGVVRRAAAANLPALVASKLTRVFLTHLHSDHTLGLPDLMLSPWVLGRPAPIDVYGPPGTAAMTRSIEEAWREDIAMRTYGMEPDHAGARAYRAVPHEIQAGRVYEDDKVKIDAIAVPHGTWPDAFGYRIQTVDRVIVISGDTRPTMTLSNACNACDVLIHEVYPASRTRSAAWQAYDSAYHTSTTELAAVARAARPRLLVLYHFRGAGADLEREIAQAGYAGRVIAGKDLDVF